MAMPNRHVTTLADTSNGMVNSNRISQGSPLRSRCSSANYLGQVNENAVYHDHNNKEGEAQPREYYALVYVSLILQIQG
jgi:hypothetical protein